MSKSQVSQLFVSLARLRQIVLVGVLLVQLLLVPAAWAGPVNWQEVSATAEGRQWWDSGSLRRNREGHVTVLSRFQPAAPDTAASAVEQSEPNRAKSRNDARLYVMELDCDQNLYRDTSVNDLPQFGPQWLPTGSDDLTAMVLLEACAAAPL